MLDDSDEDNMSVCLYPLAPHFYIVKLGFTGVYNFFLIYAQNRDCGYTLEQPHMKNMTIFQLKIIIFTAVKNCSILHRLVLVMV